MSISLWGSLSNVLKTSELDEVRKVVGGSLVDSNISSWLQLEALVEIIADNCGKKNLKGQVYEKMSKKFDQVFISRIKTELTNCQVCF